MQLYRDTPNGVPLNLKLGACMLHKIPWGYIPYVVLLHGREAFASLHFPIVLRDFRSPLVFVYTVVVEEDYLYVQLQYLIFQECKYFAEW